MVSKIDKENYGGKVGGGEEGGEKERRERKRKRERKREKERKEKEGNEKKKKKKKQTQCPFWKHLSPKFSYSK